MNFLGPPKAGVLSFSSRVVARARVLDFGRRFRLFTRVHGPKVKSMFERFISEVVKEKIS